MGKLPVLNLLIHLMNKAERFFRILDKNFGFIANDEQRKLLFKKYGDGSYINWRKFAKSIDPEIDEKDVSAFPQEQLDKLNK